VFHVELRQFPHVARAFNLSREELEAAILTPWAQGRAVDFQERRWSPERARISIYEGRELSLEEIGLGRGWANAGRTGQDVTGAMLDEARRTVVTSPAQVELQRALLARCASGALGLAQVVELAGELSLAPLASERLGLAERAVWQLLHEGRVALLRGEEQLAREQWQPVLLSWEAWTDGRVFVRAAEPVS